MSRTRAAFRPSDISRAVVAVEKAGKSVTRVEIDHTGAIVVVCANPIDADSGSADLDLVDIMRGGDGKAGKRTRGR